MDNDFSQTLVLYEPNVAPSPTGRYSATEQLSTPSPLLQATNDVQAIKAWLAQYIDSPNTFSSYRKECERLLLWSAQQQKTLAQLRHEDLLFYRRFLQSPEPAKHWVMPKGARYSRHDPRWRPFAGPLGQSSIHQALGILNSLFNWLVMAQYLPANPMALLRRRRTNPAENSATTRYLPREHWQAVLHTIHTLPKNTPRQMAQYQRYRWLFSLLYGTGLRVSEMCQHVMGDFKARSSPHGQQRWWLEITGKGGKIRHIPITAELMQELARYRQAHQLPPVPSPDEDTPLVMALLPPHQAITRAQVHYLVKNIFRRTAQRLASKGPKEQALAHHISQASTHWLRHTAGTHMVEKNIDILHVRDTLGHQSLTTTNRYLHTADEERHQHTEDKHHLGW